jgi:hypothetical protein
MSLGSPPADRVRRSRRPDTRLVVGVLLVLASVSVGARLVGGAAGTGQYWATTRDLPAGAVIADGDVEPLQARLGAAAAQYLDASTTDPVGRLLVGRVSGGELLPAAVAVRSPAGAEDDLRRVTVPVESFHLPPDLDRGSLVDVYVTPGATADGQGANRAQPQRVLAGALVVSVDRDAARLGGPQATVGVVLSVPEDDVVALVAALHSGPVDLVAVPAP